MLESDKLRQIIEIQAALVAAEFDLARFMRDVVEKVQVLTPSTAVVIELLEGDEMVYTAASGSAAGSEGLRLKQATSLSGLCVKDAEMKISSDTSVDPRVDSAACARVGAASMLCVPLFRRAKAVGVLKILSTQKNAFSEQDVLIMMLMSNLLGSALGQQLEFEQEREILRRREAANERLREFYSTLAHELRTPLSSMLGSMSMLDNKLIDPSSEAAEKLVRVAKLECERLVRLINDLLDISKIEAGALAFNVQLHPAHELVTKATNPLRQMLATAQISFEQSVGDELVVACDADRTVQILINLLSNAIKFTPTGGMVSLSASTEDSRVRFAVKDSGAGISEENYERIFERFEQLDIPSVAKKSGAGLGLAISRALVHQQGGEIGVDSKLGEGATFWFTLPTRQNTAQ